MLTQGLASKVFVPPTNAAAAKDTVFVEGDGWLDVARTRALWKAFRGPKSIVDEGQWVDRPSASIASLYIFGGMELAEVLRADGNPSEARDVFATVRNVARVVRLEQFVSGAESLFAAPSGDSSAAVPLKVNAGVPPKVQSSEPAKKKR